jgi:hypothetical protein
MKKTFILLISAILISPHALWAAVGCTLNNPDRDVRRLFPKATNYKTEFISIKKQNNGQLRREIENKLRDRLDPKYEPNDVPYAYYTVLQDKKPLGYVHGVNQKGTYGGMQLILATDPEGKILDFYYQKITSPESRNFRDKEFCQQFVGLTLKDFYLRDLKKIIKDPSKKNGKDFQATLRGLKKNLILLDEFKLKNKYDKYFYKKKGVSHDTEEKQPDEYH